MRRGCLAGWWWLLVAACLVLPALAVKAQEEPPPAAPSIEDSAPPEEGAPPEEAPPPDDGAERVRELLNAPYPVADQSVPNWWNRTTVDWRLEPAILQAYLNFWDARAEALVNLDARLLEPTAAGIVLERDRAAIEDLRAQGQVQILQVEHHAEVWEAVADEGVVYDPYVSTTYNADARTKQRIDPEYDPATFRVAYRLQRANNAWKVVDALRIVDDTTGPP
jgi:hypothetical protein